MIGIPSMPAASRDACQEIAKTLTQFRWLLQSSIRSKGGVHDSHLVVRHSAGDRPSEWRREVHGTAGQGSAREDSKGSKSRVRGVLRCGAEDLGEYAARRQESAGGLQGVRQS